MDWAKKIRSQHLFLAVSAVSAPTVYVQSEFDAYKEWTGLDFLFVGGIVHGRSMLGYGHSTMGAAVWIGLSATTNLSLGVIPGADSKTAVLAGAVIAAGAALVPDVDHKGTTISKALPPITNGLSKIINKLSGGHRKGTHSLLGLAASTALVLFVLQKTWTISIDERPFGVTVALFVLFLGSFASQALKLKIGKLESWPTALVLAIIAGLTFPSDAAWLPFAFGIGYLVHLVGDTITTDGIPWLYPFFKQDFAIPVLGDTGSIREKSLTGLLGLYFSVVLILELASKSPWVSPV